MTLILVSGPRSAGIATKVMVEVGVATREVREELVAVCMALVRERGARRHDRLRNLILGPRLHAIKPRQT